MREENIRIIFGLKLRQFRSDKAWSLAHLSKLSGLSASYLNEIEKGKKYPKAEKISALAAAFKVPYDEMVSLQLSKNLAPLGDLIITGILNDLPLEVFGFNFNKLVDWMSNAPLKVGAFAKTIIEISRNYNLQREYFYFAILRSYQEINENYFEDLEQAAKAFLAEKNTVNKQAISHEFIASFLSDNHKYNIEKFDVSKDDDLKSIRSCFIANKDKSNTLKINSEATLWQKRFILARELGFVRLEINEKERPHIPLLLKAPSFDIVLNNYRASYFGMAILMPQEALINDLKNLFEQSEWKNKNFENLLNKYAVSPELLLLRMTSLMSRYFGIKKLFFLRFQSKQTEDKYLLTRELHLSHLHSPHGNESYMHYCRRWLGTSLLKQLSEAQQQGENIEQPLIKTQFSHYSESGITYFGIALARPMLPTPNKNVSVEIGWALDNNARNKIQFLNDENIPTKQVNTTCEMCGIMDCESRAMPPSELLKKQKTKALKTKLIDLTKA